METVAPAVTLTPKAVQKVREAFAREGLKESEGGLRLGVIGGGCSGLSYQIKFDGKPRASDHVFEFEGIRVFVDRKSILYLNGMVLDYKESLMYSGFSFENPNAKKSCSCGTSFTA